MLDIVSFTEQNPFLTDLIVGIAVFVIGSTWAILYGIRNPEPEYFMGMEFGGRSRTLFLIVIALIAGAMSVQGRYSFGLGLLTLLVLCAIGAGIRSFRDNREEKRIYRSR